MMTDDEMTAAITGMVEGDDITLPILGCVSAEVVSSLGTDVTSLNVGELPVIMISSILSLF